MHVSILNVIFTFTAGRKVDDEDDYLATLEKLGNANHEKLDLTLSQ